MVPNYILKRNARMQLGNSIFSRTWLMVMLALIICDIILSTAGSIAVGIGALILTGAFSYGSARIVLSLIRGKEDIDLSDLFSGFREGFDQTLLLGLLQSLFIALWSLLFVIPGVIKSYSYALASHIQQDEEQKDWKYCLEKSEAMMKGHKWQLFCLDLSFIGWYIVGSLCFGIGTLFVMPYHYTAKCNFYEALRAQYS